MSEHGDYSTQPPTTARIASLSQWQDFFAPSSAVFRSPSTVGHSIQHLDIDLRYIDELDTSIARAPLDLPRIARITLRGCEYVQDDAARMCALAKVLMSVNPVELQWLNANDPAEQMTFSTHLVPQEILEAGERWAAEGTLRKLVIEGGFPCPNLTAPTPFYETPAHTPGHTPGHTPLPSPRPGRSTFALSPMTSLSAVSPVAGGASSQVVQAGQTSGVTSGGPISPSAPFTLQSSTYIKPRAIDPVKLARRAERWKAAEFRLKPRFDFAFGNWGASEIRWNLGGRYTAASVQTIIESLFKALNSTFPSQSRTYELPLPALLTFSPLSPAMLPRLQGLPKKLELDIKLVEWIQDCVFFSLPAHAMAPPRAASGEEQRNKGQAYARLLDVEAPSGDRDRYARRFKAEATLLGANDGSSEKVEIVPQAVLLRSVDQGRPSVPAPLQVEGGEGSAAMPRRVSSSSYISMSTSEEEDEAMTPEMGQSEEMPPPGSKGADGPAVEQITVRPEQAR